MPRGMVNFIGQQSGDYERYAWALEQGIADMLFPEAGGAGRGMERALALAFPGPTPFGGYVEGKDGLTMWAWFTSLGDRMPSRAEFLDRIRMVFRPAIPESNPWEMSNRQYGGPVWPGQAYTVGERGPELFVPSKAGTILSNEQSRALAGDTYHITIHVENSGIVGEEIPEQLARQIERTLERRQRLRRG